MGKEFPHFDALQVKNILIPTLIKMGSEYPEITNSSIQEIVLSSLKNGVSTSELRNKLSRFLDGDKSYNFTHQLYKHMHKYKDDHGNLQTFNKNHPRKPTPSRQERQLDPKHSQNFYHHDQTRKQDDNSTEIKHLPQSHHHHPTTHEISQSEKKDAPAPLFFLDSKTISLKKSDQKVKPLLFNSEGQRIDENGNVIVTHLVHKEAFSSKKDKLQMNRTSPTVKVPIRRQFRFLNPEKLSIRLEAMRKEQQLDMDVASGFPIFDAIALQRQIETPSIDWWDKPFVSLNEEGNPTFDTNGNWVQNTEEITVLYENAPPVPVPKPPPLEMPTILLKEERKRNKHIKLLQKREQEHLEIKLNLRPKETTKLKPKTMIQFQGGAAIISPTAVEMQVKQAREERIKKHEEKNASEKLTPEEKSQKKQRKREKDSDPTLNQLTATVYAIPKIYSNKQFSTLLMMGQKWCMAGGVFQVKTPEHYFIIAEGGPKGTSKFQRVVMNRINWKEPTPEFSAEDLKDNQPYLVSSGPIHKYRFFHFRKYVFNIATQAKKFCAKYAAEDCYLAASQVLNVTVN